MDYKKIFVLTFFLLLLVGSVAQVSAFMPKHTHYMIHQDSVSEQVDSDWYRACTKFPELCYTGNVLTDISVIWYWTEGYKYAVTHSPNFCRGLIEASETEEDFACAIGGCMHQPADIASHSIYNGKKGLVPTAIENSFLANSIIHVFAEQKVDNWVVKNYPGVDQQSGEALTNYDACMPLFKKVMLGYEEYDDVTEGEVDAKFDKFISEIQNSKTGYDSAFEKKSFLVNFKSLPLAVIGIYSLIMLFFSSVALLLGVKIFKREAKIRHYIAISFFVLFAGILIYIFIANATGGAFQAIVNVASPISELVPIGASPEVYVNNGIENTKAFLVNGPQWLSQTDASGFEVLGRADKKVLLMDYLLLGALLIFFAWWVYFLFKSNKIKPTQTFNY